MIAVRYHEFGAPSAVLRVEDMGVPRPEPGEVLLRMSARAINPSDLISIRGAYRARIELPRTAGYDGFGVVVEGAGHLKPGTRVVPMTHTGTWQEYTAVSARECVPVPDELSDGYAAQLFINPVSAWLMLQALGLAPGAAVVANAGGSAVGRILAQLSRACSFRLIAVVRSGEHTEDLLQLGAAAVINSTEQPVARAVVELTSGAGADAGLECVGGADAVELARALRPGSRMIQYGLLSSVSPCFASIAALGVRVQGFWLRRWLCTTPVSERAETVGAVFRAVAAQRVRLDLRKTFALRDVIRAVRESETPGPRGKILLQS